MIVCKGGPLNHYSYMVGNSYGYGLRESKARKHRPYILTRVTDRPHFRSLCKEVHFVTFPCWQKLVHRFYGMVACFIRVCPLVFGSYKPETLAEKQRLSQSTQGRLFSHRVLHGASMTSRIPHGGRVDEGASCISHASLSTR